MKTMLAITIAGLLPVSTTVRAEDQPECLRVDQITAPLVLEAGGEMDVKVRLTTSGCSLPNDYGAGTTANLTIGPQPGLEIRTGTITYSGLESTSPYFEVSRAHTIETTIEIRASKGLAKRVYTVPALFDYQAVDEQGTTIHRSLAFTIPVIVHPHEVEHGDLGKNLVVTGEVILIVLLWPILVLKCLIVGGCSSC